VVQNLEGFLISEENVRTVVKKLDPGASEGEVNRRLESLSAIIPTETSVKQAVRSSELKDITEYGRAVHAEMDALLTCARLGISVKGKRLLTTTFPCHNCTRHIIAAGLSRVTYIEPYPKSRAADLHKDAICFDLDEAERSRRIPFVPFVGVGPRRYLDLFSLELSTGAKVVRSDNDGKAIFPERAARLPRVLMLPFSYLERETKLLQEHEDVINKLEGNSHE
jgi:deoxycytidylate deaminase